MAARAVAGCLALCAMGASGLTEERRPRFGNPFARKGKSATQESDVVVPERSRPLRVHVTSIGGVGTTGFMEELKKMSPPILTNDPIDNDQIKHVPYSKLILSNGYRRERPEKIIYLYGDPTRAVMSVDRRGWFMIQARKTRSDPFPHPFPKNMQQYTNDVQSDFFQFEKHFDSFYQQCNVPVAFLRISEKTDHVNELAAFLETNVTEVRRVLVPWKQVKMVEESPELGLVKLHEAKANSSVVPLEFNPDLLPSNNDYSEVPQETKDKLKKKLSSLIKKYNDLPGFKAILPGKDCQKK